MAKNRLWRIEAGLAKEKLFSILLTVVLLSLCNLSCTHALAGSAHQTDELTDETYMDYLMSGDSVLPEGIPSGASSPQETDDFNTTDLADNNTVTQITQGDEVLASFENRIEGEAPIIIQLTDIPVLAYKVELEEQGLPTDQIGQLLNQYLEYLIQMHEDLKAELIENNISMEITREFFYVFNGIAGYIFQADDMYVIESLLNVEEVWPDGKVEALLNESVPLINADNLWLLNITGEGIRIAILDTGIDYTHTDLGNCTTPQFLAGDCPKVVGGYDTVNDDPDPIDDHGHGTHVASIAAGNGTANLYGVAPNSWLLAYKVLNQDGVGYWSWIIAGIENATTENADIISMSIGGPGSPDDPLSQAVDTAVDAGVVVTVAAGNSGPGGNYDCRRSGDGSENSICSPGVARKALTVGATDKSDIIASFSSRGPVIIDEGEGLVKPDVVAPGVDICSAQYDEWYNDKHCFDTEHIYLSGTSMSTPHIAGAAALLLQAHPNWGPEDIKAAVMNTAVDVGYNANTQGVGRIDVRRAHETYATINPGSLFMGIDHLNETQTWNSTKNLNIASKRDVSVTWDLSAIIGQPGITAILNESSITLEPYETGSFSLTVLVDNSIVPDGTYYGEIVADANHYESVIDSDTSNGNNGSDQGNQTYPINLQQTRVPFVIYKAYVLILIFSEIPDAVLVHDGSQVVEFALFPPNPMILDVPEGTYDIITLFWPQPGPSSYYVLKEGVVVEGGTIVTIVYINRTDAVYRVNFVPLNEISNPIPTGYLIGIASRIIYYKGSEIRLIVTGGTLAQPRFTVDFSSMSADYRYTFFTFAHSYDRFYNVHAYIDGVSSSVVMQNDPAEFKYIKYHYHVDDPIVDSIGVGHWISNNGFISYNTGARSIPRPFIKHSYQTPIQYPEYWWKMHRLQSFFPSNPLGEPSYSPWLKIISSSVFEAQLPHGQSIYSSDGEILHIGLKPLQWFGKYNNVPTQIQLRSYVGNFFWIFSSQMFDFMPQKDMYCRVYKDDTIIYEDNVDMLGLDYGGIDVPLPSPDEYSMFLYTKYLITSTNWSASAWTTFNTSRSDRNPPSLRNLRVLENEEMVDRIILPMQGGSRLEFGADPVGGSIDSVSAYYQYIKFHGKLIERSSWFPLDLSVNISNYTAEIPEVNASGFAFRISIVDDSSNSLDYVFEMPILIKADLKVESSDISYIPEWPNAGDVVTIAITIHNIGYVDANNFRVSVAVASYWNHYYTSIPALSEETLEFDWIAEAGTHTIEVWLDTTHIIDEVDENNNYAAKEIIVT